MPKYRITFETNIGGFNSCDEVKKSFEAGIPNSKVVSVSMVESGIEPKSKEEKRLFTQPLTVRQGDVAARCQGCGHLAHPGSDCFNMGSDHDCNCLVR